MTHENFCYWLQGYYELNALSANVGFTPEQLSVIREHLQETFNKVTGQIIKKPNSSLDELYQRGLKPTVYVQSHELDASCHAKRDCVPKDYFSV